MCFSIIAGPTTDGTEPSWVDKSGHDRAAFPPLAPTGMMTAPGRGILADPQPMSAQAQVDGKTLEIALAREYRRYLQHD
jgi:hypothetical protein